MKKFLFYVYTFFHHLFTGLRNADTIAFSSKNNSTGNDGGNIEFVKYEDGIVYIKMLGACANCQMLDLTLKEGIEAAIMSEVEGVRGVINIA